MAVVDATDETFEDLVIRASERTVVVIDFWAPWCAPCKQLGPVLESAVSSADGDVALVKVNVDENPKTAAAFQVQGIPAVFAVARGKVIGSFVGASPRPEVDKFIESIRPTAEQKRLVELLDVGDEVALRQAYQLDPANTDVIQALAAVLATSGSGAEALELLKKIPTTSEVAHIEALARTGGGVLKQDVDARLEELLPKAKVDPAARQEYLDILELLGDDPRVKDYRQRLATLLYE